MRVVNCRNTFILIFSSGSDVDKLTGAIASVLVFRPGHVPLPVPRPEPSAPPSSSSTYRWPTTRSLPKTLPSSQLRKLGLEKKLGKVLPRYANKFIKKGN